MAEIKFIDAIPEDKQHCGNCKHWENDGELFGYCSQEKDNCPSFAVCDKHVFKNECI